MLNHTSPPGSKECLLKAREPGLGLCSLELEGSFAQYWVRNHSGGAPSSETEPPCSVWSSARGTGVGRTVQPDKRNGLRCE
jgi:hypothetical protein